MYTAAEIQRYLNREMSVEEMHALEKAALDDPFLADAIEGYGLYPDAEKDKVAGDLRELKNRFTTRLAGSAEAHVPVKGIRWWRVAAAIVLLAGLGAAIYTFLYSDSQSKSNLARNETAVPSPEASPATAPGAYADTAAMPDNHTATKKLTPSLPKEIKRKPMVSSADPSVLQDSSGEQQLLSKPTEEQKADQAEAAYAPNPAMARTMEIHSAEAKKEAAYRKAPSINNFSGKITDKTNKPVSNASVLILNTQLQIETDSSGYFSFTLPDSSALVLLNAPGFENTTAKLRASNEDNHIMLMETGQASNSVMNERRRSRTSDTTVYSPNAEPVTGWAAFNRYIETNQKIPADLKTHGEVVLSFTLSATGRPVGISVEKPINKILDDEAIRLLQEGPSWNVIRDSPPKAMVRIKF